MLQLRPLYCPNCKELVFLTNPAEPQLVESADGPWKAHGCQRLGDQPLFETQLLQSMLQLDPNEGFAFKHRPGGYHGHGAPQRAVVLRLAGPHHPYFQLITPDNGLFEFKINQTEGLALGLVLNIGKARRMSSNRYRVDHWSALDALDLTEAPQTDECYCLSLQSKEQETLEAQCTRLIQYFEKQGTPVVGIRLGEIAQQTYSRRLYLTAQANVVLGLEKTNFSSQLSYSIQQVAPPKLHEP